MKVLAETRKRRKDKLWVRVVVPPHLSTSETIEEIESDLGFRLNVISQEKRHFVVACKSGVEVQSLMGLDGSKIDRHVLKVQRAEYSMTGDEIFSLVRGLLESEEELHMLRRSCGNPDPLPRSEVFAVQCTGASKGPIKQGGRQDPSLKVEATPARKDWAEPKKVHVARKPSSSSGSPRGRDEKGKSNAPPASSGKDAEKKRSPRDGVCYACERIGEACEHDYHSCPVWQARKDSQSGSSGQSTPQRGPSPPGGKPE